MSRFFRGAEDSESSSSSSSSSDSDEAPQTSRTTVGGVGGRSRFIQSDSDDDDVKRVILSAKDRRHQSLVTASNNVKNHIKVGDWSKLQEDFDELNDGLKKILKTDMVSGKAPPVPDIYLRAVITIEDLVIKTVKEKPKLSKTNQTSLNKMKLRVPKNNRQYQKEIDALRETGKATLYDMPSEDDEDSDESSSSSGAEARKKKKTGKANRWLASSGDSDSDSDDSDSSSEPSSDDDDAPGAKGSRWMKKSLDTGATTKVARKSKVRKSEVKDDMEADEEEEDDDGFTLVSRNKREDPRFAFKPEEMTEQSVDSKLIEILQARGRKGTNRQEQIYLIESLSACAKTPKQEIEIILHLIAAQFDSIPAAKLFMPATLWREALANAQKVVELAKNQFPGIRFSDEADALVEEPNILLKGGVTSSEILDPSGNPLAGTAAPTVTEDQGTSRVEVDEEGQIIVRGDIASTFERLDDELYRAWQNTDAYSPEYVERLKDEVTLLDLASDTQKYFENAAEKEETKENPNETRLNALRARAARIAARRIIHMYYKSEELNKKVENLTGRPSSDKSLTELSVLVYRYGDERAKSQTMLAHIYKHALENRFFAARDMLLMSHLQETIGESDISLQVMFNRAMTQLGLCAFRLGKPFEAHACLQELCSPSYGGGGGGPTRMRELLAQGLTQQRGYEKTPEQEKAELRRQIPYHMHINLDFIETAHLTSAMLLEVPAMALSKARGDVRRWPISKSFQYFLRNSMKQAFPGPPEHTRDFVMAATRCLMKGDWEGAFNHIAGIRSWKSLSVKERTETLERIKQLLKVEGLRTFSLSYSSYFESMSTSQLSSLFGLEPSQVHSVLSKMIINSEMRASWDQPTASIVMRRTEPSRLQSLALQLAAKTANMTDNNEKLLDAKAGGGGDRDRKEDRDERGKGGDWKQGGRHGMGRSSRQGRGGSRRSDQPGSFGTRTVRVGGEE